MTELESNLDLTGSTLEPWTCSETNHDQLERYQGGKRHEIVEAPGPFKKLALSADGNTLVAISDRGLCVFNTRTRQRLHRFAFAETIEQVAINANGQMIFLADDEQGIHKIDIPFRYQCRVGEHADKIEAMTVDDSGSTLAIASDDGSVTLLDTTCLARLGRIDCGFTAQRIAIREDRDWLLVFGNRQITVYRFSTLDRLTRFAEGDSNDLALDSDLLITEAPGGFILFDAETDNFRVLPTISYKAYDTTPDGRVLATVRNFELALWDPHSGTETRRMRTYVRRVCDVKICAEGQSLFVSGDSAVIEHFSIHGERIATLSDFRVPIMAAMTTGDERRLVVAGENGTVAVYDLVTGEVTRFHLHSCCISKLFVEGSLVATGAHDGWARVLDLDSGEELFATHFPGTPVQAVTLERNRFLVTGNYLGQVRLFDIENGELVREYYGNECTVRSVSVSPCRNYLLSTNEEGQALVFNYSTGEQVNEFQGIGTSYTGCFDESGEFFYFGDGNGRIARARPEAKRIGRRTKLHTSDVRSIRIQGDNLVSIGITDDACIIDTKTGKTRLECPVNTRHYHRVAFMNAAGTRLVTGGQDGCLMFRDPADGTILAELHNLAEGYLWITRNADGATEQGDCFHTDQEQMIQVYDRCNGVETLVNPASREYDHYLRAHNNRIETMAKVGMTPAAMDQKAGLEKAMRRDLSSDWLFRPLLE